MRLQPRFNQHYTAQAAHVSCSMKSPIDLERSIIWVTSPCTGPREFRGKVLWVHYAHIGTLSQEFASYSPCIICLVLIQCKISAFPCVYVSILKRLHHTMRKITIYFSNLFWDVTSSISAIEFSNN